MDDPHFFSTVQRKTGSTGSMADERMGQAAVEAYYQARRAGRPFAVNYERSMSLPIPPDVVWRVLLETQHLGDWLEHGRAEGDQAIGLSPSVGACVNPSWPTYLVECDQTGSKRTLTFERPFYRDGPPFYFKIVVTPSERYASTVSLSVQGPQHAPQSRLEKLLNRGFDPQYVKTAVAEVSHCVEGAHKRLHYVYWDRTNHGPTRVVSTMHGDRARWVTWSYPGDVVQYYENRQGQRSPHVGELIDYQERIGYVRQTGDSRGESYWKENSYIEPGRGYVIDVKKHHGDRIERGDRLFLLADEPSPDLAFMGLTGHHIKDNFLCVDNILVGSGESVRAGQHVATLKTKYGTATFPIRSKYDGQVTEVLKRLGDEVNRWDVIVAMRVHLLK